MSKKRAARNTKAFRKSVTKTSNNTIPLEEPVRKNAWGGINRGRRHNGFAALATGNRRHLGDE
jgi:hypothetical protein